MWFWEKESVEYEVFNKYEGALITIGVNFADAEVQDALEGCSYDLEDALRSAIEYALWLSEHEKEIFPNALLIRALQDNWKPKAWRDEYLEREMFSSPGQRWWNASEKMWGRDVRNQLVVDVFSDEDREFIKFSNAKPTTLLISGNVFLLRSEIHPRCKYLNASKLLTSENRFLYH